MLALGLEGEVEATALAAVLSFLAVALLSVDDPLIASDVPVPGAGETHGFSGNYGIRKRIKVDAGIDDFQGELLRAGPHAGIEAGRNLDLVGARLVEDVMHVTAAFATSIAEVPDDRGARQGLHAKVDAFSDGKDGSLRRSDLVDSRKGFFLERNMDRLPAQVDEFLLQIGVVDHQTAAILFVRAKLLRMDDLQYHLRAVGKGDRARLDDEWFFPLVGNEVE